MKRFKNIRMILVLGATGLAVLGWSVSAEGPTSGDVEKELRSVNDKYTEAVLKTDAAALESVTTEDFVYVNEKGMVLSRVVVAAGFRGGAIKYEKVTFEDEAIHVNGDTAWITGKYTIKGGMQGQTFDGVCRVIRVFTKTPKGWLVAHAQITKIA